MNLGCNEPLLASHQVGEWAGIEAVAGERGARWKRTGHVVARKVRCVSVVIDAPAGVVTGAPNLLLGRAHRARLLSIEGWQSKEGDGKGQHGQESRKAARGSP